MHASIAQIVVSVLYVIAAIYGARLHFTPAIIHQLAWVRTFMPERGRRMAMLAMAGYIATAAVAWACGWHLFGGTVAIAIVVMGTIGRVFLLPKVLLEEKQIVQSIAERAESAVLSAVRA